MLLNCNVGEDSWETLGLQGDQPVNPKGNQLWIFIRRTPTLWPPDVNSRFTGKDPDVGKDWKKKEKRVAKDGIVIASPTPGVYSNSCPLSRWWHPTISSSVAPFSSFLQSFPASGSFLMSQLFTSGGQSIAASVSVLPIHIQGWFPLGLSGLISLQSREFSRVFSNTTIWKHLFFSTHPSIWSNSHIHTWLLENP